ncbi:hypothetical protein [Nocardioides sp.]|uniref:hypothetical protein n=1 Tax=Nocardioides sp. TaxID=35761 RepID=UPI003529A5FE
MTAREENEEHPAIRRTAVVVVHGMGEQLPLETLHRFVRSALPKVSGQRKYYSRPEGITDSFEARRCLAPRVASRHGVIYGQTEFFEYHWSYKMTGNKLTDMLRTTLRLLVRPPWTAPAGLRGAWVLIWGLIVGFVVLAVTSVRTLEWSVAGLTALVVGEGLVAVLAVRVLHLLGNTVTKTFVDVVRYLDTSPRSYAVRRDVRAGMIELLRGLHDKGRYHRVVIAAHSLGAYIAYDALAYLWPDLCNLHEGPVSDAKAARWPEADALEDAAEVLFDKRTDAEVDPAALDAYQDAQFALWQSLRSRGNPWLVTDLVTFGTPMYFADLLYTKNRKEFDAAKRIAQFPTCPPRRGSQIVEGKDLGVGRYTWDNRGRRVLTHSAPYAVVRWTNLFYPVRYGFFGDWFGGPLRPLFGTGIRDRAVLGNKPGRLIPGVAHGKYLSYPDEDGADDFAPMLREALQLHLEDELDASLHAPDPDPETNLVKGDRS